jgi:uncharacterized protein YndB with AHSA1/START domain
MAARSQASPREDIPRLRLTRRYPVAAEKVWRAWTDPQALSRWFGPGDTRGEAQAQIDLRPGGRWHIRFFTEDGQDHDVSGVYREVEPLRKLSFTWAWKSTPERVSLVTIVLREAEGGTELDFMHERFFDRAAAEGHTRGWTAAFAKLDALLGARPGS